MHFRLNKADNSLTVDGEPVHLTGKEFDMMLELCRSTLCRSKQNLMDALYGGMDEPELKIIDVFVCKLRRKLGEGMPHDEVIETVWGQGYKFAHDRHTVTILEPEEFPVSVSIPQALANELLEMSDGKSLDEVLVAVARDGIEPYQQRMWG